jgi:hypothetical protein
MEDADVLKAFAPQLGLSRKQEFPEGPRVPPGRPVRRGGQVKAPDEFFAVRQSCRNNTRPSFPHAPLRANIDETVLLVVITEQGEKRNQP